MDRYIRQSIFPGIGSEGQRRLGAARVAILGLGATGSALANILIRAGVGALRLVDRDWVEWHNLPRQTLYTEEDARQQLPKAVAAAAHGAAINSEIALEPLVADVNADTIDEAIGAADLVLDGSDNFELRYLINDWCVRGQVPWVYTGVVASYGMTATFRPGGPCYRCAFPHAPAPGSAPTCETAGVVGPIVGALANLAAAEAMKLLTGNGTPNPGLLAVDLWSWSFDQWPLPPRDPACPACGRGEFAFLDGDQRATASLCGRNAVQVRPQIRGRLELGELAARLGQAGVESRQNGYLLRFAAEAVEWTVFPDGRAIITGTEDESHARGLYARWIGM
ncbi:MAG TPA: ThiF family adenylyltransferase [Herpetosiphonaceae bacterium]